MVEMKRTFIGALLILFTAIPLSVSAEELWVSAAISLKDAFTQLGKSFQEENQGVSVIFNFGASGDLKNQIQAGAPVDLFASASSLYMDQLMERDLMEEETVVNFAGNSMVLIESATADDVIKGFHDLTGPAVRLIAIGNPRSVPAGLYAKEILMGLGLWDALRSKLVFGENVRQTLAYVELGVVDAGIVYRSDAAITSRVKVIERVPADAHSPVLYPIGVLKASSHKELAQSFVSFIMSRKGQRIIQEHGFEPAAILGE